MAGQMDENPTNQDLPAFGVGTLIQWPIRQALGRYVLVATALFLPLLMVACDPRVTIRQAGTQKRERTVVWSSA